MEQDVGLRINEKATVPVQSEIVTNSDIWPLFGWMSYERGACMLHMLRSMLGDEAFFSSITSYFTENAYSSVRGKLFLCVATVLSFFPPQGNMLLNQNI